MSNSIAEPFRRRSRHGKFICSFIWYVVLKEKYLCMRFMSEVERLRSTVDWSCMI